MNAPHCVRNAQLEAKVFSIYCATPTESDRLLGLVERGSAFLYDVSDRLLLKNVSESFH
jgi:hypothetical protein